MQKIHKHKIYDKQTVQLNGQHCHTYIGLSWNHCVSFVSICFDCVPLIIISVK